MYLVTYLISKKIDSSIIEDSDITDEDDENCDIFTGADNDIPPPINTAINYALIIQT